MLDKLQWSSRLCSKSMLSKFKREREKKKGGGWGEKRKGRRGRARKRQSQRGSNEARKEQQAYFHSLLKMWENTIALRLQQPTAYKPMSEGSCQTVFHTKYSDPLSHGPAVQCTAPQTVLLWRKLVVPMCKLLYQEGGKLGSSHCPCSQFSADIRKRGGGC